jgi:phosphoesterase RecJ-like protein
VKSHERFLLTSHVRPDGDALGSELGMAHVLEALGKQTRIVNADDVPPHLTFLDPEHRIGQLGQDVQAKDLADCDALIVLDTSSWVQLGVMTDVLRTTSATKIVIDHHVSQDDLGAETFKDTEAEATGRLVVEAAEHLGVTLTAPMAHALFVAIATDTGWFRFNSTTGDTFRYTSRLVDAGAVPAEIYASLYEQDSLARLRLVGRVLARTEVELDGRLIHTSVSNHDFRETGALRSDTDNVINTTMTVAGTEVAVIFFEQSDGTLKASFRSRGELDVSRIAESFGGGGHRAAAGASIDEPFDAARAKVLDAVRACMR